MSSEESEEVVALINMGVGSMYIATQLNFIKYQTKILEL